MLLLGVGSFLSNIYGPLIRNLINSLFSNRLVVMAEMVPTTIGQTSFTLKVEILDILVYKIGEGFISLTTRFGRL